jgi:hypothetical protein
MRLAIWILGTAAACLTPSPASTTESSVQISATVAAFCDLPTVATHGCIQIRCNTPAQFGIDASRGTAPYGLQSMRLSNVGSLRLGLGVSGLSRPEKDRLDGCESHSGHQYISAMNEGNGVIRIVVVPAF